jgi:hypothetical protein
VAFNILDTIGQTMEKNKTKKLKHVVLTLHSGRDIICTLHKPVENLVRVNLIENETLVTDGFTLVMISAIATARVVWE